MTLYSCCSHCPKGPHEDHDRPCSTSSLCHGATELPSKAPSSPVEATEPVSNPDLHLCDSVVLTWLEIGAATREGIAKEIEAQMQYEGVRAQRVMAMAAGIARTWKP